MMNAAHNKPNRNGKAFQAEVFFQKLFGKRRGVQKVGFMPISRV